jgi:hypothetical protein
MVRKMRKKTITIICLSFLIPCFLIARVKQVSADDTFKMEMEIGSDWESVFFYYEVGDLLVVSWYAIVGNNAMDVFVLDSANFTAFTENRAYTPLYLINDTLSGFFNYTIINPGLYFTVFDGRGLSGGYVRFQVSIIKNPMSDDTANEASVLDSPILYKISPTKSITGSVLLEWSYVPYAVSYSIYRYNSMITELNESVSMIRTVADIQFLDSNLTDGNYYYAIVAHNATGSSHFSNSEGVNVEISTDIPSDSKIPGYQPILLCGILILTLLGIAVSLRKKMIRY